MEEQGKGVEVGGLRVKWRRRRIDEIKQDLRKEAGTSLVAQITKNLPAMQEIWA